MSTFNKDEVYYSVIPRDNEEAYRLLTTRSLLMERFSEHAHVVEALENEEEHISIVLQGKNKEVLDERLLLKTPNHLAEPIRKDIIQTEGEDIMANNMVAFPSEASIPDED